MIDGVPGIAIRLVLFPEEERTLINAVDRAIGGTFHR